MLKALTDYARGSAIAHAMFLILYGVITYVHMNTLWVGTRVHDTISQLPYAPKSWGTLSILIGVSIFVGLAKHNERVVGWSCFLGAVWCLVFAVAFLVDYVQDDSPPIALVGALIYTYIAMTMLHSFVLGRRLHSERV